MLFRSDERAICFGGGKVPKTGGLSGNFEFAYEKIERQEIILNQSNWNPPMDGSCSKGVAPTPFPQNITKLRQQITQ